MLAHLPPTCTRAMAPFFLITTSILFNSTYSIRYAHRLVGANCWLPCANLRSKLCTTDPWIVQVLHVHWWNVAHCEAYHAGQKTPHPQRRLELWGIPCWTKTSSSTRKVGSKEPRRKQTEEIKSFLSGAIPVMDVLSTPRVCVYCNTPLLIYMGTMFGGHDCTLPLLVWLWRIGFLTFWALLWV